MKAIFYLTASTLTIQTEKTVLKRITLPEDMVSADKSVNTPNLRSYFEEQITSIAKKASPGVVILGSGVLAQVVVPKGEELASFKEELLKNLTFSQEYVVEKTIETKTKTYILIANKALFQAVVDACRSVGIEIGAVLPFSLFSDLDAEESLTKKDIKVMLKQKELYKVGDFLSEVTTEEEKIPEKAELSIDETKKEENEVVSPVDEVTLGEVYTKQSRWNTARLLVVLGFLIVLTMLMGGLIYFQQMRSQGSNNAPEASQAVTPTPTPLPKEVAKTDLKVSIENGTGTAGQAGKVKDLLSGIGYSTITTGNAESNDHDKTEITFSSQVSATQQQEIKNLLLATFTAVTTKVDNQATDDITIITGSEK